MNFVRLFVILEAAKPYSSIENHIVASWLQKIGALMATEVAAWVLGLMRFSLAIMVVSEFAVRV